jgi:hypothetical protein
MSILDFSPARRGIGFWIKEKEKYVTITRESQGIPIDSERRKFNPLIYKSPFFNPK